MPAPASVTCGRCNGLTSEVADLVDHCIDRVLKSRGNVEEVRGDARTRLEKVGGLAAVCRFMSSVRAPVSAEKS
jgi:hypothetical protein